MKKILNYNLFAALALVTLSSCNDDDTTFTKSDKATVTASVTSLTLAEGTSGQVTLTLDKPLNTKTDVKIELLSGSTGEFRDFSVSYGSNAPIDLETIPDDGWGYIGYKLEIPAYTTSLTFDVNAEIDFAVEGSENLVLQLTPAGNGVGLIAEGSEAINLTITNTVSTNFDVEMSWSAPFANTHGTIVNTEYTGVDNLLHDYCGFDFDLEIYDASLSSVLYQDYDGCPAKSTIEGTDPDGDYVIVPSFWTRVVAAGSVPKSGEIIFPVEVTMGKKGSFFHTTDLTGRFKYTLGGAVQGNPDAYIPVAIVTKTGTSYVLTDFNTADVLGSGRYASIIQKIKNLKRSKK